MVQVANRHLMCRRHWDLIPAEVQREVMASMVPGQHESGYSTFAYELALKHAACVARQIEETSRVPAFLLGGGG